MINNFQASNHTASCAHTRSIQCCAPHLSIQTDKTTLPPSPKHHPVRGIYHPRLTFVNVHLQNLALLDDLHSITGLAAQLGVDGLSLSPTLRAHGLDLLNHAWRQLLHSNLHSCTTAVSALLHCPLFSTTTCRQCSSQASVSLVTFGKHALHLNGGNSSLLGCR